MSRLSRESIAAEAIALADEEGFDAVSMRRVAQRMGVGTMSLYHYVATKQELMSLMGDAIMRTALIPDDEVPEGWRAGLTAIAHRTRAIFADHPWVRAGWASRDRGEPGPSVVHHVEQTLAIMSELDFMAPSERIALSSLVDEYVVGHVFSMPSTREPLDPDWMDYLAEQAATGAFPRLAELFAEGDLAEPPDAFERGLELVLDGIALEIERRRP